MSTIAQKREVCGQLRGAGHVEAGLAPLASCLCGADRRLRVPTLLEFLTGRSGIEPE